MEVIDFDLDTAIQPSQSVRESELNTRAPTDKQTDLHTAEIPLAHVLLPMDDGGEVTPLSSPLSTESRAPRTVMLEFSDLCFGTAGKTILNGVSGFALPGQVIAIMGPSGAGKTTLLDCLAGRLNAAPSNIASGTLLVNGSKRNQSDFRKISAYVLQSDYFFPEMTVRETIMLSARLRLPKDVSDQEKVDRVDQIIKELSLTKCQHTYVGNELIRGVSGGERKRVNIGTELVTDPALIFLDEPTSGLDSYSAESVMATLLKLARGQKTIITTIHQPRSSIYAMFDNLLLLSDGRSMYFGAARDASTYFANLGYPCPPSFNPSDHFLDILSLDQRDPETEKVTRARVEQFADAYTRRLEVVLKQRKSKFVAVQESDQLAQSDPTASKSSCASKYASGWFQQFWELSRRSVTNISRQKENNIAVLAQTIVFAVLLGVIWLRTAGAKSGTTVQSVAGLLFFAIVNQAFSGAFMVIFLFPTERAVVLKERASRTYHLGAYFWSKSLVDLPRIMLTNMIFSIITYYMVGLREGGEHFLAYFILLVMTQLASESISYAVSAGAKDAQMASAIVPVFIVTTMLFGGFFIGTDSIPIWLRWLRYISFVKYAFAATLQNEYQTRDLDLTACSRSFCPSSGDDALSFYGVTDLPYWANFVILLGLIVGLRVLAYAILLRKGPKFDATV